MNKEIRSLAAAAILSALCCAPAYASTKISHVTGDSSATNGCVLRSVAGYGGYGYNVVVYGVDCPSDPEVFPQRNDYWTEYSNWCEMSMYTSGYHLTGGCGSYGVYRN
jgi:hypothetical protein